MADKLNAVAVEFDLPFMLLVEDGFGPFRKEGHTDFQFTALGVPITLRFARKVRTEKSALLDLHHPQDSAHYTRAQVWFDGPTLQERTGSPDYRTQAGDLIDLALTVLQRYVALYRELTGSFRLRPPTRAEIPEFAFVGFLEDGRKVSYLYETPSEHAAEPERRAAVDAAVRDRFISDYDPDPVQALAFTVRDLFERCEYWQATLAVATLFEVKLARLLRIWFERMNEAPSAIDARLIDAAGTPYPPETLLLRYLPQVTETEHPLSAVYQNWHASARALREAMLLGRRDVIGADEAARAIVSVSALVNGLETLFEGPAPALPPPAVR
jgi:hypothetical protein